MSIQIESNPLYGTYKEGKVNLDWLYKKYRGICWLCRKFVPRDQASRDHIKPASLGGGPEKENMALAHKICNTKRGNGYREVYFKHHDTLAVDLKDVAILEEHGLIVQFWADKKNGGFNILVAKRREETPHGPKQRRSGVH